MGMADDAALKGPSRMGLLTDMMNIMSSGARVARAIDDYIEHRTDEALARGDNRQTSWISLKHAIEFRKAIINSCMSDSPQVFAQLKGVGPVTSRKLFAYAKDFNQLGSMYEWKIEACLNKKPPAGANILELVHALPHYAIAMNQEGYLPLERAARFKVDCHFIGSEKAKRQTKGAHIIIGTLTNQLLFYKRVRPTELPWVGSFDLPQGEGNPDETNQVKAWIIDDETGKS